MKKISGVAAVASTFAIVAGLSSCSQRAIEQPPAPHRIVEGYPVKISQLLKARSDQLAQAAQGVGNHPFYVIVKPPKHWKPGSTVKVAFFGGNPDLYAKIEQAAQQWTSPGYANLKLDFHNPNGSYRTWNPSDQSYSADIRVAFQGGEMGGYWSLVGTDSLDPTVGGAAGDVSLNLQGFDQQLPQDWQAITVHEFGHALGFEHEHQSPVSQCDFRFDDDPGYVPTKDADGWFTTDSGGRRPGLYTYLGGYPNQWPRQKVDFNLRQLPNSNAFDYGPFDKLSIMKYYFDPFMFYKGVNSPCYTGSENLVISTQDRAGVDREYPANAQQAVARSQSELQISRDTLSSPTASPELKSSIRNKLSNSGAASM